MIDDFLMRFLYVRLCVRRTPGVCYVRYIRQETGSRVTRITIEGNKSCRVCRMDICWLIKNVQFLINWIAAGHFGQI